MQPGPGRLVPMDNSARRIRNPRCFLIYALAPEYMTAAEANRIFNEFIANAGLPLPIFHDHFIGRPGGIAIFHVDKPAERDTLLDQTDLDGWHVEYRPLIFSRSPAAFDEQVAFTLRAYRGKRWEDLRREKRPSYGNASREADTAEEE